MSEKEIVRVARAARHVKDRPATNLRELAAILERDRALYVLRWREHGNACASRPDALSEEKWYGDGSLWTDERIKAALDPAVFDPAAKPKPAAKVAKLALAVDAAAEVKPWQAAGVSRRTWFYRQKKDKGGVE